MMVPSLHIAYLQVPKIVRPWCLKGQKNRHYLGTLRDGWIVLAVGQQIGKNINYLPAV